MSIEVVFEKRINNEPVSTHADAEQRREYALLMLLASMFVLGLLFYGWQQYRWLQAGYEIEGAQKQRGELEEYGKQLLVERNTLANPERVDRIARNRLGMTVAAPGQAVTFAADDPLTIPAPPAQEPPALTASNKEVR
jgi:cell division protein FtsL